MKQITYIPIWICLLLGFVGCQNSSDRADRMVSVTIEPQRFFAEQIAGEDWTIHCVVPSGQSPESYDPTPQQIIQIGKSRAYLRIGPIGFEQSWMEKIKENHPQLPVFDLSEGMPRIHTEETHHHHTHAEGDPHIWNSIRGARVMAAHTLRAFQQLDPERSDSYQARYDRLMQTIQATADTLHAKLDTLTERSFIIYHPALTYLADEFGLTQLCIEMEGKEPSPAQLKELVETARTQQTRVVFIQQEFDQKNAELIAKETGCRLVVIHPLHYDWPKEMIHIANSMAHGKAD